MNLKLSLIPKQKLLYNLILSGKQRWVGYGGARGGAKTHAIRSIALKLGLELGLKVLIFRRMHSELLDTHINPLLENHPELRSLYSSSESILYNDKGNPAIRFGYAERDADIYKFQGVEYPVIFIDEATQASEHQIRFLSTSNRIIGGSGFVPKMVLTTNPGGASHAYIKRIFVDKRYRDNEIDGDYAFIQSHLWDNVFWVINDLNQKGYTINDYYNVWDENKRRDFCLEYAEYAKTLSGLPTDMREAYLYGNWDIFGGMFFGDFNKRTQVIEPFEIPPEWKIIGSIDPGYSSPCSFGLTAQDFEGNYYRIGTYYESNRSPVQHAQAIRNWLYHPDSIIRKFIGDRKIDTIIAGKDAFAKKDRYAILANDITFSDVFSDNGMYLMPAITDRKQGWWAWKMLIPNKYFVFDKMNSPLLDEMLSVVSDPSSIEDIQGRGNDMTVADHALDEQRYAIMSLYRPMTYRGDNPKIFRISDYIDDNVGAYNKAVL